MPSPIVTIARPHRSNIPSLPLDIQCLIIIDHLVPEYRLYRTRTYNYRVPASYDIDVNRDTNDVDRHTFGRYALVSRYWCSLIQPILFQKFQFEGLHTLRELQVLCKANPALATYTRELRVVAGDWEAPPKSVLTMNSGLSSVPVGPYRRVAPEPTVLEQFCQTMWGMLQHWSSARRGKRYGMRLSLEIEFYISNPATGLPQSYTPLDTTGYAERKLEFLESLVIKAHNVFKPTLRRILPPVFYPAPLIPIVIAARELRKLALRTEIIFEEDGSDSSDEDTFALTPSSDLVSVARRGSCVPVPLSSTLVQFLPRIAEYKSLRSAQLELFVAKPLRPGAPDLLCRALRKLSYPLAEFKVFLSHSSPEIILPGLEDDTADEESQSRWQEMVNYSVAFGEQDSWGDAYFMSEGHRQSTRHPRLERIEPFMRTAVEALIEMPKIEKWEVGSIDLCLTINVTRRDRHGEIATCHHTKSYLPSNAVKELMRQRWPQIRFEQSQGPKLMSWRGL